MVRHIFIGTFKDSISEELRNKELANLRAIKEKISGVLELHADFTTGWFGVKGQIVMTVDLASGDDFAKYLVHPYHADYLVSQGKEFFADYCAAQFEF